MPTEVGSYIFVAIMTLLSIPIIALLKWKPKRKDQDKKLIDIMERLKKLEESKLESDSELDKVSKEVSFLSRLIENKNQ